MAKEKMDTFTVEVSAVNDVESKLVTTSVHVAMTFLQSVAHEGASIVVRASLADGDRLRGTDEYAYTLLEACGAKTT